MWVPFVLPPLLLLLAVVLQAIESRLLGNVPEAAEPPDIAVSAAPALTPAHARAVNAETSWLTEGTA